jgi:hypothetical protein
MGILDYSTTPGSNTTINGIGISGGSSIKYGNDAIMQFMADVRVAVTKSTDKAAGTYMAAKADHNQLWRVTGDATINLTSAATLTAGWALWVMADGGTATIDPAGSEKINGADTLTLTSGNSAFIVCTATAFRAIIFNAAATLGNAAYLNVGTTAGTVAAGDDSRITGALQRSGGQMTGDLTLKGDPTTALMAATKQYADARGAPDAVMEDQKAAGTAGGSATTGAWIVRDLNTVVRNAGSVVSLSGNEFTPSVDGWVEWSSPTGSPVSNNSTRLYDVTDGVVAGFGTSNRKVDDASSSYSFGGAFVTAGKTYRIEHRFATAKSTDGLGMAGTFQTEVYTRVRFWRAA